MYDISIPRDNPMYKILLDWVYSHYIKYILWKLHLLRQVNAVELLVCKQFRSHNPYQISYEIAWHNISFVTFATEHENKSFVFKLCFLLMVSHLIYILVKSGSLVFFTYSVIKHTIKDSFI